MLSKCCCCFSLRTGSLIIAWIGIIATVLELIAFLVLAAHSKEIADSGFNDSYGYNKRELNEEIRKIGSKIVLYIGVCGITFSISGLLVYGLMIQGIKKVKPSFILPYLMMVGFGLGIFALFIVLHLLLCLCFGEFMQFFGLLISSGIGLAIAGYPWLVIFSFYKSMLQTGPGQEPFRVEYGVLKL